MFNFFKNYILGKNGLDNTNLDNKQDDEKLKNEEVESFELDNIINNLNETKYVLKEDFKIMAQTLPFPFPCDNINILDQSILKVRKSLISDPDEVAVYINLVYIEDFRVMEEAFIQQVEVNNPCGTGTIVGEALLKEAILVGGVNYSLLLFDTLARRTVYDGVSQADTVYSLYKIVPFNEEVTVDVNNVQAVFDTTLTRLPELEDVQFYMYRVDGTIRLEVTA